MSETAPEAPARRGNVLTNRIGPLPLWVWVLVVIAAYLVWGRVSGKFGGGASAAQSQTGANAKPQAFLVPPYVGVWTYQAFPPDNEPPAPGEPVKAHARHKKAAPETDKQEDAEEEEAKDDRQGHRDRDHHHRPRRRR